MIIILFLVNILIKKIINNKVIVLPFQELVEEYNISNNSIKYTSFLINNYHDYKTKIEIKIGKPPKNLPFLINSNIKTFRTRIQKLIKNLDFNKYDNYTPSKSSSFKNISEITKEHIYGYSIINETIILYRDKNCNEEIEIRDFQMYLENIDNNRNSEAIEKLIKSNYTYTYGELGLSTIKSNDNICILYKELKDLGIINSPIYTIEYTTDKGGLIYIGEYPHIYNNKFKEEIFMTAYNIPVQGYTSQLKLLIDKLYIKNLTNSEYINFKNNVIYFNFGLGIILCTQEYYNKINETFFKKYINLNICEINKESDLRNTFYIFSCEKRQEFKIEEFPSLFLFKEEFKYTFELNYKDLFQEVNNKYYFLIVYSVYNNNFELGKPFLKKYQITYNEDSNTIHYYNELLNKENKQNDNNNENDNNKFNIYILIIILLIIFFIGLILISFFIGKTIYQKRKLRANELNDEYDYITPINNS